MKNKDITEPLQEMALKLKKIIIEKTMLSKAILLITQ